jgi:translocator protein
MKKYLPALFFIGISFFAGFLGSIFTISAIPGWYATLIKPVFSPPNYVFGPVWSILYLLMGISAYLVWKEGLGKKKVKMALKIFFVQLALNTLWSILFFGLKSPTLSFIEIILLWILIFVTIKEFYQISKIAGLLLVPYILWVTFASILNVSIVLLNP